MAETYTLDDFLKSIEQIQRMGSMKSLLNMIPGLSKVAGEIDADVDKDIRTMKAIIQSMTRAERCSPDGIDVSRRGRIASGSGADPEVVDELLKQFRSMGNMFRQLGWNDDRQLPPNDDSEPTLEW